MARRNGNERPFVSAGLHSGAPQELALLISCFASFAPSVGLQNQASLGSENIQRRS